MILSTQPAVREKGNALKKILYSCVLLCFSIANAQQQASIIPPPPEAAAFFKSTDIPVSMYTGLPNIGVDFYTIKTKELTIPIRLTYNARGIQVAEMASRAGIGWALQYGGMISRQVRGSADELTGGILYNTFYNQAFLDANVRANLHTNIVNNGIDEFPDQFYFDVNGEGGKFIIDHNNDSVVLQKFDNTQIIPIYSNEEGIAAWVVTDKMGNKFYYGRSKDGTRKANDHNFVSENYSFSNLSGMASLGNSESRPNTAWHLMEIETYFQEKIEFLYQLEEGIQYSRSYDKTELPPAAQPAHDPTNNGQSQVKSYFSKLYSNQHQIHEIRFPGGKVQFEQESTPRIDYTNTHALKNVLIKDDQGNAVKGFELSYFNERCADDDNQLAYLKQIDTSANYRMFLYSIKEIDSSGATLPPYLFDYNTTKLPNRFSNSQDNWGYYNGKANGRYLTFFTYLNPVNRQVDTSLAGAGLLQKITYPTGGKTAFTYEQNRVMPPPFIVSLLTNQNNPLDTVVVGEAFFKDPALFNNGMYSKDFTIGANIVPQSLVHFSFVEPLTPDASVINYEIILERLDSTTTIYLESTQTDRQLNLAPGQYRLKVIPTGNSTNSAFIASVRWSVVITNPHSLPNGEWYGAGKRIKKIGTLNGTTAATVREYEYFSTDSLTSGLMLGMPNFYFIQPAWQNYSFSAIDQYGSMPGSPLTQLQGNSIGYSRVTEYQGTRDNNQGKTVQEFTLIQDGGSYYQFPYHLPNDMEWLRGKPLVTKSYKRTGSGYDLVKSSENAYLYNGTMGHPGLLMEPFVHADSGYVYRKERNIHYLPLMILKRADGAGNTNIDFKVYHLSSGTADLDSTVEKDYSNGSELVRGTKYGYNYSKHYLPVSQRSQTSKGNSITATTRFSLDISNKTPAEQKLVEVNRVALPVQSETIVRNGADVQLSRVITNTVYKQWPKGFVMPELIQSAINSAPLSTDVTYSRYNGLGAPQEIMSRAGIKEVYIWGYKGQYPVAKIIGSDYATAASFVDTVMLENAALYTPAQLSTELNKIRTGLANSIAEVVTYTYKPMIGIASVTDPKNQTMHYEYDSFGRLRLVRDHQSNILKKICYNYQGQIETCID